MKVHEIMTQYPAVCTPETTLDVVAHMMVVHHCGAIPVVEKLENRRLIGIITDRDIVCRILAKRTNPFEATAVSAMSSPVATVRPDEDIEKCFEMMEINQVRRLPVIDEEDSCVGIVSQGKLSQKLAERKSGEVERVIAQKTDAPSRVGEVLSHLREHERSRPYHGQ